MRTINIHTVAAPSGIGDLIYLVNWFKVYRKYASAVDDRILIFVTDIVKVYKFLQSLHELQPKHPIFELIDISCCDHSIAPENKVIINNRLVITKVQLDKRMLSGVLEDYFFDIDNMAIVNVIYISCTVIAMVTKNPTLRINQEINIYELGMKYDNSLGLSEDKLGILTDIDGITGQEDFKFLLNAISNELKKLIFADADISIDGFEQFIINTPVIFAYMQDGTDIYVLHALLCSSIIQDAIANNKKPLFVITGHITEELPNSIQNAIGAGQIKLVNVGWLSSKDYHALNALFLNRKVQSLIAPSGDNGLSACIKAGKLPFYAHNEAPYIMQYAKSKIFREMLKIIITGLENKIFTPSPGAAACLNVIFELANPYVYSEIAYQAKHIPFLYTYCLSSCDQIKKSKYHEERGRFLNQGALDFFRDHLAPFIMREFDFEKRSLPGILERLSEVDRFPANTTKNKMW